MSSFLCRFMLCFGALIFLANPLRAQNLPTAKQSISISAYGGYTYLQPDYGQYNDHGFVVGADVGRPLHSVLASVDARYNYATGDGVGEKSFVGGPMISKRFRRFSPYAEGLIGYGILTFTHPASSTYTQDNSVVFGFAGGVEYRVWNNLSVKGDLQYQWWKLGEANSYLTPVAISAGIAYRVPLSFVHRH